MLRRREFIASALAAAVIDIPRAMAAEESLRVFWWGNPDRAKRTGEVIKQFEAARGMMRAVGGMGMKGKMGLMRSIMGGGLTGMGMPGGPMLRTKKSGWQEPKDRNKKKKRR